MDSRKIRILIDAGTGRQINAAGNRITRSGELPRFLFGDLAVVCVSLHHVEESGGVKTLTPAALPESGLYRFFGALALGDELLFDTESDAVNLPGSWTDDTDPDPAQGELTFTVNTGTLTLKNALAGREKRKCRFVITATPVNTLVPRVLAADDLELENRPDAESSSVVALENTFVTTQALANYFKADAGFEFSEDAVSWHSVRTTSDCYYRPAEQENAMIFCIGPAAAIGGVTAAQARKIAQSQAIIFG